MPTIGSEKLSALDCLHNIARQYDRLDNTEYERLVIQAQKGSRKAYEKIVLHMLSLSLWVSRKMRHGTLDQEERFGLCIEALMRAISRYNPKRGKFDVYAVDCMKNQLLTTFAKIKRHESWRDSVPQTKPFLAPDLWTDARQRLWHDAERVVVAVECIQQHSLSKYSQPVFITRYGLSNSFQKATYREIQTSLKISFDTAWDALEDAWRVLLNEQIHPSTEKEFLKLLQRIELLGELTETTVDLGLEAA